MCKHMNKIEEDFFMLSKESKEKIRGIICKELCHGKCNQNYLEQKSKP